MDKGGLPDRSDDQVQRVEVAIYWAIVVLKQLAWLNFAKKCRDRTGSWHGNASGREGGTVTSGNETNYQQ